MTENHETPASEEAITSADVVAYVVKQVKNNPKAYAVGAGVVAFLVIKKFRSGSKEATKALENFTPGTIRMFAGPYGTDTFELSVMLKGDELRQAMAGQGLTVVAKK